MVLTLKRSLAVTILLTAGMIYYHVGLLIPHAEAAHAQQQLDGGYHYGGDFYPVWLTTRELFHHKNPYTDAMTRQIQIGLFGRILDPTRPTDPPQHYRAFSYPLYTDVIATPAAALTFPQVRIVLSFLSPVLAVVTVWLWLMAFDLKLSFVPAAIVMLLTLTSYPVLEAIFAQQPLLIVAAMVAGANASLARGHYLASGVLLALGSIKPQIVILLAIWLLAWAAGNFSRRKSFVFGFVLTLALLFGTSEFVLPGWFGFWRAALTDYRQYTPPPLTELVLGKILGRLVSCALGGLAVLAAIRWRRVSADSAEFQLLSAFVLLISVIALSSSIAVYDQFLMLPGLVWLTIHRERILRASLPVRLVAIATLAACFWPWVAATAIAVSAPFMPWARSLSVMVMPLTTAASLPFAVVSLLAFFVRTSIVREA